MAGKDASISLQTLGGVWEFVGTDRTRGVWAENLELVADIWGSLSGSFDLHRDPRAIEPDIAAFSQCDVEIGGVKVWSGRVKGTPTRDGSDQSLNVQLEGWQAHLDDDVYQPTYVHTSLTDWLDSRSNITADLTVFKSGWSISSQSTGVRIAWPQGQAAAGSGQVYFDAGPGNLISKITWTASATTWAANNGLFVLAGESHNGLGAVAGDSIAKGTITAGTNFTDGWTLTNPRRYVAFRIDSNGHTPAADEWFQFSGIKVYANAAYESGGSSAIKAPTIVNDAINRSTVFISSDRSQVATTTFNVPSWWVPDYKSPREVINGVNAYHNYATKIDTDKRMVFQPLPSAPQVEVGDFSALDFQDASQGSGEDVYNRAIVEATSATGQLLKIVRSSATLPGAPLTPITTPSVDNPSFATAVTPGWTSTVGTLTRTTTAGEFDSSPAGGKFTSGGSAIGTMTGTFKAGVTYVLSGRFKAGTATNASLWMYSAGNPLDLAIRTMTLTTSFQTFSVAWTPSADHTDGRIFVSGPVGTGFFLDSFALFSSGLQTVVDKRGFQRTKILQVNSPLPDDGIAGAQIADTYLQGHKTTPFKGQFTLTGPARDILTGRSVAPEQLLLRTTELIRLNHLIDPDTGAVGRDGRIVQVTYSLATDQAKTDLDSTSGNYEALVSRLGALSSTSN